MTRANPATRRDPRWLAARLLAAVLTLTVAAGCAAVPSSTPPVVVGAAPPVGVPNGNDIVLEPDAPRDGMTPEEIVRGFMTASASTAPGHPVARQYLTPKAADAWQDDTKVTVIADNYSAVASADSEEVNLTATTIAEVDGAGVYRLSPSTLDEHFGMAKVSGQWRIAEPPDGILIANGDFARVYPQTDLYFLDPTRKHVVPDPRYYSVAPEKRANTVVEQLLAGPSTWLAPAVRTELGDGVALRSGVVQDGDTAVVELTGLTEKSPQQVAALSAQLVWTLRMLPGVNRVRISNDGEPLPGVNEVQGVNDWEAYDPDVIPVNSVGHFIHNGGLWRDDGSPIPGPAGGDGYGLTSAGVSLTQEYLAGVQSTDTGARLLVGPYGGELSLVDLVAQTLTAPTWGGYADEVWTVRDGVDVLRVPVSGEPEVVPAPQLAGLGKVSVLRLSRDGTRAVAVIVAPNGRSSVYIGRVVQENDSRRIEGFTAIAPSFDSVSDACWYDSGTVYVVAKDRASPSVKPYIVEVDGSLTDPQTINGLQPGPMAAAAAAGRPPLASVGGRMWRLGETNWAVLVRSQPDLSGTQPIYPG